MKKYMKPEMNISKFWTENVVTTSSGVKGIVNNKTNGNYKSVSASELFGSSSD